MLYEVEWAEDGTYVPGNEFSPERFFNDGLCNSKEFDLQLGYFSSATISVLAEGFATFITNGGKMRLVINQIVSENDKEAIKRGVFGTIIDCFDLTNFETLKETFDEYQQQFFDCLAFLIKIKRIDIRIIKPKGKKGISHTKSGQFRDGDSITSFTGSANFTLSGLFNNLEEIKIDRSDSIDRMTRKRIENQRKDFDAIMMHQKKGIEYLSPDDLVSAIQSSFGDKDIDELIDVEKKLRQIKRYKQMEQETMDSIVAEEIPEIEPRFPYPSGPREYQQTAFENWKNNGQKGLFAMATGTGKTITSLNCLLEIYKRKGYYKAIILVPTITLVGQWEDECKKFNFRNITRVCSKNPRWLEQIDEIVLNEKLTGANNTISYIIISTYASFVKDKVFKSLSSFPRTKLLLIADEAHNMGSRRMLNILDGIPYVRRIGLSATPERQFDDEANHALFSFFGAEHEFTYEYSMQDAIDKGVLCRYYYYPHLVKLTVREMDEYMRISTKLARFFNNNHFTNSNEILTALLLKRKRIIHKAKNKLEVFREILEQRYQDNGNLKYTLVYVPEGLKPDTTDADVFDEADQMLDDDFSEKLINEYTSIVSSIDSKITVRKFTSGIKDREELLRDFASGDIEVLTSMKCLDEGVDVPRSELAIFCASTGNPRQFIQRRGRILRKHPDKHFAVIHDLVVAPEVNLSEASYAMERSLLASELRRVRNFSLLSENSDDTIIEFENIMNYYNLSIFNDGTLQQ